MTRFFDGIRKRINDFLDDTFLSEQYSSDFDDNPHLDYFCEESNTEAIMTYSESLKRFQSKDILDIVNELIGKNHE